MPSTSVPRDTLWVAMVSYRLFVVLFLCFAKCSGVIYHLNDSDYQRMPPLFALDEYDACLSEEGSSYCLVELNLYAEPENQLMHMIQDYSNNKVKHYNHSIINRGVCVRRTCKKFTDNVNTTMDLTDSLEACLNDSIWKEYGLNAKLAKLLYCDHHNEQMDINALDWSVLVVIAILVLLNIIGSLYEYYLSKVNNNNKEIENTFLLSFSVKRNWKWLINTEDPNIQTRDLQSIHGARVILNICMVLAHAMLLVASGFTTNPHEFEKTFERPFYHLIYNGLMIVQVFFYISGFLTVYFLQLENKKRKFTALDIPKLIVMRLCRLLPALAMTLAITLTWVRHLGSGPLWKLFVTGSLVADCKAYWWHTLLFVNNYMSDNKFCLIPTWYVAADVQVFVIGLLAYILPRPHQRHRVFAAVLLVGVLAPAIHTVLQDLDAIVIMMPEFYRTLVNPTYRFQHILGHNNLPCFIIGMISASILCEWKKKGDDLPVNFKLLSYAPNLGLVAIPLIFYSGRMFYHDGERTSLWLRAVYSAAIRLVLGVVCAFVMPALVMRSRSLIKTMYEWPMWVVPSRLSYCVYLLHMILVHVLMGARPQLNSVSYLYVTINHLGIVFMSYIIAVPFYLLVEAPFNRIFKSLLRKPDCQRAHPQECIKNNKHE